MTLIGLAFRSLWNRRGLAIVTIISICLSVTLLLGVERVRDGARDGFAGTVAGTDLIVGARSGALQLMLYSVFRIGDAPNNFSWDSFEAIAERPEVAWIIPISLGDSHRGFRVVGTDERYFEHLRFRDGQALKFASGTPMQDLFDAVVGAAVARELGYAIGDTIVINHGLGSEALAEHANRPFTISGILEPTGTPVDRSVHIGLPGIEALHADDGHDHDHLAPSSITAAFIGLHSPIDTFALQRAINQYRDEPLTAAVPGLALLELWSVLEVAELALRVIGGLVVLVAAAGMVTTLLAMLAQRRREMAILRAIGAAPHHIASLLFAEAMLLSLCGMGLAILGVALAMAALGPWIARSYGLQLSAGWPGGSELVLLSLVLAASAIAAAVPAIQAYRQSVADGITPQD